MGRIEGRSVIRPVTRDGHHFSSGLEGFDEPLFVCRTGACNDLEIASNLLKLLVCQCGQFRPGDDILGRIPVRPDSNLAPYFHCGAGVVTRDDFNVDSGVKAFTDSVRDIFPNRVREGEQRDEMQPGDLEFSVGDCVLIGFQFLESQRKHSHAPLLVNL